MFLRDIIMILLLSCAFVDSMAKDQKLSSNIEKLLIRVRRQGVNLGGMCMTAEQCMAGNGGPNTECVVPPNDEVLLCRCLPGFGINQRCLPSCATNADCPVTNMCVDGQCAPLCNPVACNAGTCRPPLLCVNDVCVPDCSAILPFLPSAPGTTTTTAGPGTTTAPSGVTATTAPTVNVAPILQCSQPSGQTCSTDRNALCINNVCVCVPGTTLINGNCVSVGLPLAPCDSNNQCPGDGNAMCDTNTNMCACVSGTTLLDGSCVALGLPGGGCEFGECPGDLNAVCTNEHGIELCQCKPGTTKIEGSCLPDGAVGGKCDGDGFMCTKDQFAECQGGEPFGMCVCRPGARKIEGMCVLDGAVGGKCNGQYNDTCSRDPNAECMNGYCVCKAGTKKVEGSCVEVGKPGAECTVGGLCPYDMMSSCASNSTCACSWGSVKMGGSCVIDGYDGGRCSYGKCFNKLSMCDLARNRCVCRPGSTAVAGQCITLEFLHWIHMKIRIPYHDRANSNTPMIVHKYI